MSRKERFYTQVSFFITDEKEKRFYLSSLMKEEAIQPRLPSFASTRTLSPSRRTNLTDSPWLGVAMTPEGGLSGSFRRGILRTNTPVPGSYPLIVRSWPGANSVCLDWGSGWLLKTDRIWDVPQPVTDIVAIRESTESIVTGMRQKKRFFL